jgi:glucose dehydrogenase
MEGLSFYGMLMTWDRGTPLRWFWTIRYTLAEPREIPGTSSVSHQTPLYVKGKLYMETAFGKLFCMDANDGKMIWEIDLFTDYDGQNNKWGVTENLLIDGDMLFCTPGGTINNVIAIDRNNGNLIWSCPGNGEVSAYCSPLLVELPNRKLFVTQPENCSGRTPNLINGRFMQIPPISRMVIYIAFQGMAREESN